MEIDLDDGRYWFLTWTTYGTWLPGDKRGFVSDVWDAASRTWTRHNIPGTPYDADWPERRAAARKLMAGPAVRLSRLQADAVLQQFLETSRYRHWNLLAASIMANHCHLVVKVEGDPEPSDVLGAYKSYASRKLNRNWGARIGRWWTKGGSKRRLETEANVMAAVRYVLDQPYPLASWTCGFPEHGISPGHFISS